MEFGFKIYFEDETIYVPQASLSCTADGLASVYKTEVRGAQITWRFEPYESGTFVNLEICSEKALRIRRIDSLVFSVGVPRNTDRILFLGRNMYENETRYPCELGQGIESSITCLGKFADLSKEGILLAGVAPFENVYGSVACKNADDSFTFSAKTEYTEGMLDETCLRTETAYLCENITIDAFFTAYRALLATSHFDMPKLTGWNTWDYYLADVKPEDIAENVAALKDMPFADLINYIVIDDGWQNGWGNWTENEKFSCGLAAVAKNIQDAGFIPGLWMAPLVVKEDVAIFTQHPEWLCRDENGQLFRQSTHYYLDPTVPEAETFILDNYRYQYAAGFRLFKIDYVSPIIKVKKFFDKTATPYGVLANLINRIKECTGPDAVILGCSLPLECGPDIAPSMRIAVDIHNHFSHAIWIAQSLAWSWMYNNRFARIDPDFLVVRGEETSNEPVIWHGGQRNDFVPPRKHLQTESDRTKSRWRHGEQFNAIEAETWANLVAVSGGNIFLSDRMSVLNQRGISIIQNALTLAGDEVRPIYLSDDKRLASVWQGDKALLIVNWEDVPREIRFSGVSYPIESDKPFMQEGDTITVSLLPHESFAAKRV